MPDLSRSVIQPIFPAFPGIFFTTKLPGKPPPLTPPALLYHFVWCYSAFHQVTILPGVPVVAPDHGYYLGIIINKTPFKVSEVSHAD